MDRWRNKTYDFDFNLHFVSSFIAKINKSSKLLVCILRDPYIIYNVQ